MWLHIEVVDRVAVVPGWALCIIFGVMVGWLRWRAFR